MKKLTILCLSILTVTTFVACGDKGSSPAAAPAVASVCPVGTTLQTNVCIAPNGSVTYPNTGVGTAPATGARFYSDNWSARNLMVLGTQTGGGFANFIQNAMGACGPFTNGGDCGPWVNGAFDMVLLSDSVQANQFTVVFRLKPYYTGPTFRPATVPLNFTVSVTNNYQGFEGRAYGDINSPSNRSLIQLQVATGKLEDAYFDYRIAYAGEVIMNGRFQKCNTADCGLSSNIGN